MNPERIMPASMEAEQSTLGAMLLDNSTIDTVRGQLSPDDFYREHHRKIAQVVFALYDEKKPVDLITLSMELRRVDLLEEVGGADYISDLEKVCPSSANVEAYIAEVVEMAQRRRLIKIGNEITDDAFHSEAGAEALRSKFEQAILGVGQKKDSGNLYDLSTVAVSVMKRLEDQINNPGRIDGISTGFKDLDRMIGGFQRENMIVVGARPGMGKSAFAMQIGFNIAKQDLGVLVFSLEMPAVQLGQRIICNEGEVDFGQFRRGRVEAQDMPRVFDAAERMEMVPFWIQDTPGMSAHDIAARARRVESENGQLGCIIIDYLQLISGIKGSPSRAEEIAKITMSIRIMARERKCPVILLSQLSRECEKRENKRPVLSDLRDGGAIEAEANEVLFLYNDAYYKKPNERIPDKYGGNDWEESRETDGDITEVIVAKQRNGERGTVRLRWTGKHVRFDDVDRPQRAFQETPAIAAPAPTWEPGVGWRNQTI